MRTALLLLAATVLMAADANLDPITAPEVPWERGDTVVVVGDSHGQTGVVNWIEQLRRGLAAKRPEMGVTVTQMGSSRARNFEMGITTDLLALKPTVVVANLGLSELYQTKPNKPATKEEFEASVQSAIRRLREAGILVVLTTPIPAERKAGGAEQDPLLASFAEVQRGIAASQGLELADFRQAVEGMPTAVGDLGINQAGANVLATTAAAAIGAALTKAPMEIEIEGGEYLNAVTVPIRVRRVRNPDQVEIRYSMTGKDPNPKTGSIYKRPLKISSNCTLIAVATDLTTGATARAEVRFERAKALPVDRPGRRAPGLSYEFYRGQFKNVRDFLTRAGEPEAKGVAMGPDLQAVIEDETNAEPLPVVNDFALIFTGFVDVPTEGIYTFFVRSADGARLTIGDQVVADNDGIHGPAERSGRVGLREGTHAFRLEYFKAANPAYKPVLEVSIEGPGMRKIRMPDMLLCYDQAAKPKPRPAAAPAEDKSKDPRKPEAKPAK